MPQTTLSIYDLPQELLVDCTTRFLDPQSRSSLKKTCRFFKEMLDENDDYFYRHQLLQFMTHPQEPEDETWEQFYRRVSDSVLRLTRQCTYRQNYYKLARLACKISADRTLAIALRHLSLSDRKAFITEHIHTAMRNNSEDTFYALQASVSSAEFAATIETVFDKRIPVYAFQSLLFCKTLLSAAPNPLVHVIKPFKQNNREKATSQSKDMPLTIACQFGSVEVSNYLLSFYPSHEFQRNALLGTSEDLARPLHGAFSSGSIEMVRFICNRIGKKDLPDALRSVDHERKTVLHHALFCSCDVAIIKSIPEQICAGLLFIIDKDGKYPLQLALRGGLLRKVNVEVCLYFLSLVKRLYDAQNVLLQERIVARDGWTILHHAVHTGNIAIVQGILELCPDLLFIKDIDGMYSFQLALQEGHVEISLCLLSLVKAKRDTNSVRLHLTECNQRTNENAFSYATRSGKAKLIAMVLNEFDPEQQLSARFNLNASNFNFSNTEVASLQLLLEPLNPSQKKAWLLRTDVFNNNIFHYIVGDGNRERPANHSLATLRAVI